MLLIALPFLSNRGERSPRRRPWAVAAVLMTVVMIATLWVEGANSPWSPNFNAPPLPPSIVGATNGPVFIGAQLFHAKACLNCHLIGDDGGRRGPDLTDVANRLSKNQMILRISNGGVNMPAYAANLAPAEMDALVAFLQSRKIQRR
jgi:ubiquinol-cytochrome c reductase cytochrome b subunit